MALDLSIFMRMVVTQVAIVTDNIGSRRRHLCPSQTHMEFNGFYDSPSNCVVSGFPPFPRENIINGTARATGEVLKVRIIFAGVTVCDNPHFVLIVGTLAGVHP